MSMAEDTRKRPDFSSDNPSNAPRESGSDPLAELARLIGQNDPFNDVGKRALARKPFDSFKADDRPAPEWLARPASSVDRDEDYAVGQHAPHAADAAPPYQPGHHDTAGSYAPAEQDYRPQAAASDIAHESPYAAREPHAGRDFAAHEPQADPYQGDDRYRVALPSGDHEGDGYYADDGHLPPQGEERPATDRRRSGIVTIAAVLGLAVIGTAGAFGYRAFTSGSGASSSPPVIKADTAPAKTVPPAPAAAADAQGKPFQDRIGGADPVTRTAPREEQPVALPVPPASRAAAPLPAATAPQLSAQSAAPLVAPMPPASAMNEPKRVKTIPIRPDNNVADPAPTASASAGRASAAKQQSGAAPMSINPPSDPAPRTKTATRSPAPAAPVAGGSYVVQVSAQRTEAEAQSSYQSLQAKYPSVLSGRNANIKRVDLGDKGGVFFRAQVGSFATSEQASAFCDSLKSAGGQCIVQRN
jgi:hypothetical protein